MATIAPWQLRRESVDSVASMVVSLVAVTVLEAAVTILTGFSALWPAAGVCLLCVVVALVFAATVTGVRARGQFGPVMLQALAPLLPASVLLLVLLALQGSTGFWYSFWMSPDFRVAVLTTALSVVVTMPFMMLSSHTAADRWTRVPATITSIGAGAVALSVLLPDWAIALRYLDRPLNFAPATETMVFALRTYAGINLETGSKSLAAGAMLVATGLALRFGVHIATRVASGRSE
jgi:hypothetical protein